MANGLQADAWYQRAKAKTKATGMRLESPDGRKTEVLERRSSHASDDTQALGDQTATWASADVCANTGPDCILELDDNSAKTCIEVPRMQQTVSVTLRTTCGDVELDPQQVGGQVLVRKICRHRAMPFIQGTQEWECARCLSQRETQRIWKQPKAVCSARYRSRSTQRPTLERK
jgi:hypothetical protein